MTQPLWPGVSGSAVKHKLHYSTVQDPPLSGPTTVSVAQYAPIHPHLEQSGREMMEGKTPSPEVTQGQMNI